MNLSQLRFAVAVANHGSFTAAAAACCVTQPTLSNGIAQLELELGERLFVRTTRSVESTPFGQHLLPYAREVLQAQTTLAQQAAVFLKPHTKLIRIGTSPLINNSLLALMIEPYRSQHPDVEVVLREMNMTDLYRMLKGGLLDFVVGVTGLQKGAWSTAPLYSEPLLFIPRGTAPHATKRGDTVQMKDIASDTFVMVPDACGLARSTRELFRRHRRRLIEYSGEAMSYQVLEEWATLGVGAAILPRSKVSGSGRSAVPISDRDGAAVTIAFEATWSRNASQNPHLEDFSKHLLSVVPEIATDMTPPPVQARARAPR